MKNNWLNLVLLLTNRIYHRKQKITSESGFSAIYNILLLVVSEVVLGFVSLPLYLGMKSDGVTAFLSEKGSYQKVSFDYSLRRVITLTGTGIIAAIWAVKLILIIVLPATYGPMKLYSVSNFSPADILAKDLIANEIGVQTARTMSNIPRPELTAVEKTGGGNYDFVGKGQPNSMVVLMLSDKQTAVYSTNVDKDGNWQINHLQNTFRLSEGNHSVIIFSYDQKLGVRSETAPEQFFKVTTTFLDTVIKNVDILANWSVVIILLLGVFLTFLTI